MRAYRSLFYGNLVKNSEIVCTKKWRRKLLWFENIHGNSKHTFHYHDQRPKHELCELVVYSRQSNFLVQ